MSRHSRGPWLALGLVLVWRLALLVFTAQPVPANDAFFFDGAVVHWLLHGHYFNPSLAEAFPISGHHVFAAYPPLYQGALAIWMSVFGPGALSAMAMHFAMFCGAGFLVTAIVVEAFPTLACSGLSVLFLFGITFDDRPEGLAHLLGLAALLIVARQLNDKDRGLVSEAGISLLLLCALYTSPIVGAFYFGSALLTRAAARLFARQRVSIGAFVATTLLFALIALFIAMAHPLLWNGFLENSRQTPVATTGFRVPGMSELIKLARTAPVFILAAVWLPFRLARRKRGVAPEGGEVARISLMVGITATGLVLLVLSMVLLSPNYVMYVLFAQVLLAAGLLSLEVGPPGSSRRPLQAAVACCLALVSLRAAGMSTWGVACASDVSYRRAQGIVRDELLPFSRTSDFVIVSSAYLYGAEQMGLQQALHSDWPYDRRFDGPDANCQALIRLRPPKLVLTQFDFYRGYKRVVGQLRERPDLVSVNVRDTTGIRTPDSIPSLQRVVQHISWAPIIVTLSWK